MIRITVSYPATPGARFDHDYYRQQHRQLLLDRLSALGLQRVEIDQCLADGTGGTPPFVAAAHMFFTSLPEFQSAMAQHGAEIMGDIRHYTDIRPQVLISAVVA